MTGAADRPDPTGGVLAGVRVVDLTTTLMGPYCTMLLARMGAEVVKVESPEGDIARGIGDTQGTGLGPLFLSTNHGKRSLAIDLKDARGREALLTVLESADVFVTNLRPAAIERLGLGPDAILERNPACVVASLVGFGQGGRYAGLAAYDDVIQAASGMAWMQGGQEPAYVRSSFTDKIVGVMASNAILAALYQRSRTGAGVEVTVPMFESMVAFNLLEHQGGHIYDPPAGPAIYERVVSSYRKPYRSSDGYLGVVVYTDRMWLSFFELVGRPDLADDPRFRTITGRTEHVDELYALIESELVKQPSAYWMERLSALGIPVIPVRRFEDLFQDGHLDDVGFFEDVTHPVAGRLRLPSLAISFSTGAPASLRPAPVLGEHSRTVLTRAGLSAEAIGQLEAAGVVVSAPGREER